MQFELIEDTCIPLKCSYCNNKPTDIYVVVNEDTGEDISEEWCCDECGGLILDTGGRKGDKVKIVKDIEYSQNGNYYVSQNIDKGKIYTLEEYLMDSANGKYWIFEEKNSHGIQDKWAFEFQMELINKSDNVAKNMGLTEKFLSSLKKEPEKSWRKAGITNGDDIPTDEGMKLICTVLLQTNEDIRKEMAKIAKDILEDEKDKD